MKVLTYRVTEYRGNYSAWLQAWNLNTGSKQSATAEGFASLIDFLQKANRAGATDFK